MNSHVFTPPILLFFMNDSMKMKHHNSRTKIKIVMSIHSSQIAKIKQILHKTNVLAQLA